MSEKNKFNDEIDEIAPPLTGHFSENNVIQKSRDLLQLYKAELNLEDYKLIDTYLSRINSHKPNQRTVIIEKSELEKLFGITTKIYNSVLKQRCKRVMNNSSITIKDGEDGFRIINLFEEFSYDLDTGSKSGKLRMTCTPKARKLIFSLDSSGYFKYRIRQTIRITSLQTYLLFSWLMSIKGIEKTAGKISIEQLKQMLRADSDCYSDYRYFNRDVLKKCQTELITKNILFFEYDPIRDGKRVVAIHFKNIKTPVEPIDEENENESLPSPPPKKRGRPRKNTIIEVSPEEDIEEEEDSQKTKHDEDREFLSGACKDNFSEKEMEVIIDILRQGSYPIHRYDAPGSRIMAMYDFLSTQYKNFEQIIEQHENNGSPIKSHFSYFKKMIKSQLDLE